MQELILEEKTTLSPVMKEIYRRLRTNLEFTGIENKVICLTSCMENDGKSSVSFNLAKILAENDKRVLFIDADMRNSVLTKRTGIADDLKGLSHYLAGKNAASEVIYATNYKNKKWLMYHLKYLKIVEMQIRIVFLCGLRECGIDIRICRTSI